MERTQEEAKNQNCGIEQITSPVSSISRDELGWE
jgi:hypothetical protein